MSLEQIRNTIDRVFRKLTKHGCYLNLTEEDIQGTINFAVRNLEYSRYDPLLKFPGFCDIPDHIEKYFYYEKTFLDLIKTHNDLVDKGIYEKTQIQVDLSNIEISEENEFEFDVIGRDFDYYSDEDRERVMNNINRFTKEQNTHTSDTEEYNTESDSEEYNTEERLDNLKVPENVDNIDETSANKIINQLTNLRGENESSDNSFINDENTSHHTQSEPTSSSLTESSKEEIESNELVNHMKYCITELDKLKNRLSYKINDEKHQLDVYNESIEEISGNIITALQKEGQDLNFDEAKKLALKYYIDPQKKLIKKCENKLRDIKSTLKEWRKKLKDAKKSNINEFDVETEYNYLRDIDANYINATADNEIEDSFIDNRTEVLNNPPSSESSQDDSSLRSDEVDEEEEFDINDILGPESNRSQNSSDQSINQLSNLQTDQISKQSFDHQNSNLNSQFSSHSKQSIQNFQNTNYIDPSSEMTNNPFVLDQSQSSQAFNPQGQVPRTRPNPDPFGIPINFPQPSQNLVIPSMQQHTQQNIIRSIHPTNHGDYFDEDVIAADEAYMSQHFKVKGNQPGKPGHSGKKKREPKIEEENIFRLGLHVLPEMHQNPRYTNQFTLQTAYGNLYEHQKKVTKISRTIKLLSHNGMYTSNDGMALFNQVAGITIQNAQVVTNLLLGTINHNYVRLKKRKYHKKSINPTLFHFPIAAKQQTPFLQNVFDQLLQLRSDVITYSDHLISIIKPDHFKNQERETTDNDRKQTELVKEQIKQGAIFVRECIEWAIYFAEAYVFGTEEEVYCLKENTTENNYIGDQNPGYDKFKGSVLKKLCFPSYSAHAYSGNYVSVFGRSILYSVFHRVAMGSIKGKEYQKRSVRYQPQNMENSINVSKLSKIRTYVSGVKEGQKSREAVKGLEDQSEEPSTETNRNATNTTTTADVRKKYYDNINKGFRFVKPQEDQTLERFIEGRNALKSQGYVYLPIPPGRGDKTMLWTDINWFHHNLPFETRRGLAMLIRAEIIPQDLFKHFRVASIETGAVYKLETSIRYGVQLALDKKYGTISNMPDVAYNRHAPLVECTWMQYTSNRARFYKKWEDVFNDYIIDDTLYLYSKNCITDPFNKTHVNKITTNADIIKTESKTLNKHLTRCINKIASLYNFTRDDLVNCSRKERVKRHEVVAGVMMLTLKHTKIDENITNQIHQAGVEKRASEQNTIRNKDYTSITKRQYITLKFRPEVDFLTLLQYSNTTLRPREIFYTTMGMTIYNIPKLKNNHANYLELLIKQENDKMDEQGLHVLIRDSLRKGPYVRWKAIHAEAVATYGSKIAETMFADHWYTLALGNDPETNLMLTETNRRIGDQLLRINDTKFTQERLRQEEARRKGINLMSNVDEANKAAMNAIINELNEQQAVARSQDNSIMNNIVPNEQQQDQAVIFNDPYTDDEGDSSDTMVADTGSDGNTKPVKKSETKKKKVRKTAKGDEEAEKGNEEVEKGNEEVEKRNELGDLVF